MFLQGIDSCSRLSVNGFCFSHSSQFSSPAPDLPSLSWSGMASAGATRQTAITMSRFVCGIFSAKGRDYRRPDAERVSRKGTLGWFWRCFRVVAHYCHAITIATQDQPGCSILLKKAQSSLMPNRCRMRVFDSFRNCAILARPEKLQHRNLYALTRRESSATRVASISSMWRNLGEQVSKLAAPIPPSAPHLF